MKLSFSLAVILGTGSILHAKGEAMEPIEDPDGRRRLGHGGLHNGKCCNSSGVTQHVLISDGEECSWDTLENGECVGGWFSDIDCEGMTCGGGFYKVGGILGGRCSTPDNDSWPFTSRRWTPDGCGDPGSEGPSDICGRDFTSLPQGPPAVPWGPRPGETCQPTPSPTPSPTAKPTDPPPNQSPPAPPGSSPPNYSPPSYSPPSHSGPPA